MSKTLFVIAIILHYGLYSQSGLKTEQMRYSRVKNAFENEWPKVKNELTAKGIKPGEAMDVFIRIFKLDMLMEVWVKNKSNKTYTLWKNIEVCALSGEAGPKRKEGDGQVPEGFYNIDLYNPTSNYYLSMRVSYPNASDKILGKKGSLGGAIMIHGNCVTIGCVPITDEKIKELYPLCLESANSGGKVKTEIYPCKPGTDKMKKLQNAYANNKDFIQLWESLTEAYNYFERNKYQPTIKVNAKGNYSIE